MTRLYIAGRVPGVPTIFLVGHHEGNNEVGNTLFTNTLPKDFKTVGYSFTDSIQEADYVLFPHAIKRKQDSLHDALAAARIVAQEANKPLMVWVGGDLSHNIYIDDALVIKGSQYRTLLRSNEYIAVPIAEDFAEIRTIVPRAKSARPVVSFCGWAGFSTPLMYVKYLLKNLGIDIARIVTGRPQLIVFKKGLYWRRKALRLLERDSRIDTRCIVRNSFSANSKTISLDPQQARDEYVTNMYESDFVLAPKGDGNFSVRFFEALSMGRIPVLIDTDCVLPLEEYVKYDECIIRIPYQDVGRIGEILAHRYALMSDEEFADMQIAARQAYVQYLRYDRYLDTLFTQVLPQHFQNFVRTG